jgi:hypothetical protein
MTDEHNVVIDQEINHLVNPRVIWNNMKHTIFLQNTCKNNHHRETETEVPLQSHGDRYSTTEYETQLRIQRGIARLNHHKGEHHEDPHDTYY